MKPTWVFVLATGLSCLLACSGRTIRLDHDPAAGGGAGVPVEPDGPTRVYQVPGAPLAEGELLVDERRVYWLSEDQGFRSCLKDDCQHSLVTYTTSADPSRAVQYTSNIAVSAGQVFWLALPPRGTIYSCPSAGCATEPIRLLRDSSLLTSQGLAAEEGEVYWVSTREVYRCAAAGCGSFPELTSLGEGALPIFFGSEGFWIQRLDTTSRIRRAPTDGSSEAVTLAEVANSVDGYDAIQEIAVNSKHVYWLDETSRILRCPVSGCDGEPSVLMAEAGDKQRLRADELGVYWLDFHDSTEDSGAVVRNYDAVHFCADSGCAASTALATFEDLKTYALDRDFIYFTAHVPRDWGSVAGDIMRMPKPKL